MVFLTCFCLLVYSWLSCFSSRKKRLLPSTTATPLLPGTRLEAAATTCLVACSRGRCMSSKDEDDKDKKDKERIKVRKWKRMMMMTMMMMMMMMVMVMLLILLGLNSYIVAYLILIGLVPLALPGHLLGGSDIQLRHHPHSMDLGHREAARPGNSTAETTTSTR